jgi:hypothetical protein
MVTSRTLTVAFLAFVTLLLTARVAHAVTVEELVLNEANCAAIRANVLLYGYVPCACRLNTGNVVAYQCYPHCCPRTDTFEGDRCDMENNLTWSVYEQKVCIPKPQSEYLDDTANCFYKGNEPEITSVATAAGSTTLGFRLSVDPDLSCDDLFVAQCQTRRPGLYGYRLNTTTLPTPGQCWLPCAPSAIQDCTATACVANRGITPAVQQTWTLSTRLPIGDYALVCYTLMHYDAEGSTLYQETYSSSYFRVST